MASMCPAYNGMTPWIPSNNEEDIREEWKAGLQYERMFFDEDMEAASLKPEEVPVPVQNRRKGCIFLAMDKSDMTPLEVEILTTRLDRCMLTSDDPDEEIEDFKLLFSNGDFDIDVDEFEGYQVQTPSMWFRRMAGITADSVSSEVMNMFQDIAIDGSLAHLRPSRVAGAMFVHLLGIDEAEQHLCGYDLFDVAAVVDKLRIIL